MTNMDLEEQADIAIQETLSSLTVAIDVSGQDVPAWGTGSLIKFKGRYFILTCSHVVEEGRKNDEIGVLFPPKGKLKTAKKTVVQSTSLESLIRFYAGSYRQKIDIIHRYYSQADDLVLLELDSSSDNIKANSFYDLAERGIITPQSDQLIVLAGFSRELARDLGGKKMGVLPYFLKTALSTKMIETSSFNSETQFLIEHTYDEESAEPQGISGCGVWVRLPSGKNNIWTSNLYLAGVERAVYPKNEVLVVTKADRIMELFLKV